MPSVQSFVACLHAERGSQRCRSACCEAAASWSRRAINWQRQLLALHFPLPLPLALPPPPPPEPLPPRFLPLRRPGPSLVYSSSTPPYSADQSSCAMRGLTASSWRADRALYIEACTTARRGIKIEHATQLGIRHTCTCTTDGNFKGGRRRSLRMLRSEAGHEKQHMSNLLTHPSRNNLEWIANDKSSIANASDHAAMDDTSLPIKIMRCRHASETLNVNCWRPLVGASARPCALAARVPRASRNNINPEASCARNKA